MLRQSLLVFFWLLAAPAFALSNDDPHRNEIGFFDVHVCHWPNRPLFFLGLFSTVRYDEIDDIRLFAPSGKEVGVFNLTRYRRDAKPGKPEKHVFLNIFDIPPEREEGWYSARIHLKDGRIFQARDRVQLLSLPIAQDLQPSPGAENVPLPKELRWSAVPGALYYQVFIKDVWNDEKVILTSSLLSEPRLVLPPGLIKPGGRYLWQVHSRNLNEDPVWGDFNHGSLTAEVEFSVAD